MARNAEKAMTTLARWRASQLENQTIQPVKRRRPYFPSDCNDLRDAQKFRLDIVREITRKVAQIQNAGLGEHRIRDLNDQINRLLRDKKKWEDRIKELGGTEFRSTNKFEANAKEVPGNKGYKYFGAAKDLPGVRELLNQETISLPKKTKAELMKSIDADYYGYRDEDDGIILKEEMKIQREELLKIAMNEENSASIEEIQARIDQICGNSNDDNNNNNDDGNTKDELDFAGPKNFISHVPYIPTQQEIREELLRRKKQELLEAFASDDMIEMENENQTDVGVE